VVQAYTHVVDHGNGELLVLASSQGCGEGQNIGLGCAVSSLELVIVGGTVLQAWDLNVVEKLVAHGNQAERAWRSTVVAGALSQSCLCIPHWGALRGSSSRGHLLQVAGVSAVH